MRDVREASASIAKCSRIRKRLVDHVDTLDSPQRDREEAGGTIPNRSLRLAPRPPARQLLTSIRFDLIGFDRIRIDVGSVDHTSRPATSTCGSGRRATPRHSTHVATPSTRLQSTRPRRPPARPIFAPDEYEPVHLEHSFLYSCYFCASNRSPIASLRVASRPLQLHTLNEESSRVR